MLPLTVVTPERPSASSGLRATHWTIARLLNGSWTTGLAPLVPTVGTVWNVVPAAGARTSCARAVTAAPAVLTTVGFHACQSVWLSCAAPLAPAMRRLMKYDRVPPPRVSAARVWVAAEPLVVWVLAAE